MSDPAIDALFAPDSVAVVGASPDSWYASRLIRNLTEYGFDGELYYVNPGRETVFDEPCYDSLSELPTVVDLAVISIPRQYVVETLAEAGELGVPSALIITAGFAEADEQGVTLEAELESVIEETGMAVCGPNTIGYANMHADTVATALCSRPPGEGSIGLVSQSGALAFATFYERGKDADQEFAYVIATGNETGLSLADYVTYLADDEVVDVIATYIEGVAEPRRFIDAASRAGAAGTPVLAVKTGRSAVAKTASLSHTGSITGQDAAWEAAFERAGIERVPDIPDLLHRSRVHTAYDAPAGPNVCIASTSGGLASLLADLAADRDLTLPNIDGETERALLEMDGLLTFGEMHNPADIRGYGAEVLPEIAAPLLEDPAFDAYVFAVGLSAVDERAETIAEDMITIAERADDPVVFLWTGRKAAEPGQESPLPYERVRSAAPLYADPATCMDAVASLVAAGDRPTPTALDRTPTLDEPLPSLPSDATLTWDEVTELLAAVDVTPVETAYAETPTAARAHAKRLGGPVVLKVDAAALPHRSDVGAVAVDVPVEAVPGEFTAVKEAAATAVGADAIDGVLVQRTVDPADKLEILVGVSTDASFGPTLTVAPGGVGVETHGEERAVTLIPPVDATTVKARLSASPLGDLLDGYRGQPAVDTAGLADLVAGIGDLVVAAESPAIAELDLNPVFVGPDGVSIVDLFARTAG